MRMPRLAEVVAAYQNDDGGWHRFDSDMPASLSTLSQTHIGLQLLLWIDPTRKLFTRPNGNFPSECAT